MAISHIDSTSARATSTEIVTVTAPTGIADDDQLLAWYIHTDNDVAPVTLTGFTQVEAGYEEGVTGQDTTFAMLRKTASSESGNYALTGDTPASAPAQTSNGVVSCFRGVDTTTPLDVTYVQGSHVSKNATPATTNPAITTNTDNAVVVLFIWVSGASVTGFTAPSGYTEIEELINTSSNMAVAYKEVTTAGTETPGAWTATGIGTTETVEMMTLALKPASTASSSVINVRRRQ